MAHKRGTRVGVHGLSGLLEVSPDVLVGMLGVVGDEVEGGIRNLEFTNEVAAEWEYSILKFKGLNLAIETRYGMRIYLKGARGNRDVGELLRNKNRQEVFIHIPGSVFDRISQDECLNILKFVDERACNSLSIDAYIDDYGYRHTYTPAQIRNKVSRYIKKRAQALSEGAQEPKGIKSGILDKFFKEKRIEDGGARGYSCSYHGITASGSAMTSVVLNARQVGKRKPCQILHIYHKATEMRLEGGDERWDESDFVRWEVKISKDVGRAFLEQMMRRVGSGEAFGDSLRIQTASAIIRIIDIESKCGKRCARFLRIVGGGSKMRVGRQIADRVDDELDRIGAQEERLKVRYLMARANNGSRAAWEELKGQSYLLKQQDISKYKRLHERFEEKEIGKSSIEEERNEQKRRMLN